MTATDEKRLAMLSVLANTGTRIEQVAGHALDRGDDVADLLLRAAYDRDAFDEASAAVERHGGLGLGLLDLVVEVGQLDLVRQGLPRTWVWPHRSEHKDTNGEAA